MAPYRNSPTKRCTLRGASVSAPTGTVVLHTVLLILIALFALYSVHGAWAGAPTDQLRDGVDRVFKILRDPELAGDTKAAQRRTAIVKAADEIFDFGEMAKRSLGQHWAAANAGRARGVRPPLHRADPALVHLQGGPARRREDDRSGARRSTATTPSCGRRSPSSNGQRDAARLPDAQRRATAGRCTTSASTGSASWRTTGRNSTRSSGPPRTRPWWRSSSRTRPNSRRPRPPPEARLRGDRHAGTVTGSGSAVADRPDPADRRAALLRPPGVDGLRGVRPGRARRRLRGAFPDARDVQVPPAPAPPAVRHALQGLRRGLRPARGHRRGRARARRSRPPRPTRPAWPASFAPAPSGRRASAIGSTPAASKRTPCCTCRSTRCETTLDTVASQEDLLADFAATPTLDRLVDGINQYVGATFLPGVFGPGAEDERARRPPASFAIS